MAEYNWQKIVEKIEKSDKILLTTHNNPDGDGLGAEAALYHCLKHLGKSPFILNSSPLPPEYVFLNEDRIFHTYSNKQNQVELAEYDLLMILDASHTERLGSLGPVLNSLNAPTICIDHHPFNNCLPENISVIDDKAPATVALVFELLKIIAPQAIDQKVAE
ncbi:MAG TPA: DHH family phosphoesterase, partial [Candidatus Marinimicrobia bacterium]|nr:DHH family phosphoesterase [Candidatus Neomarinimicrobiota bacterium]